MFGVESSTFGVAARQRSTAMLLFFWPARTKIPPFSILESNSIQYLRRSINRPVPVRREIVFPVLLFTHILDTCNFQGSCTESRRLRLLVLCVLPPLAVAAAAGRPEGYSAASPTPFWTTTQRAAFPPCSPTPPWRVREEPRG